MTRVPVLTFGRKSPNALLLPGRVAFLPNAPLWLLEKALFDGDRLFAFQHFAN
ncbi:MAG: hypothetical protein ACR2OV_10075 [Hyphomicrobiaceae bacterium]